ncbi:hypothetical protein HPB49_001388 [Dermacentor silvarum]|uniref:Uncharacterized protein n=1 Tax=Dermacentor silvarum TaxID=543639 RepID=A0ACB8CJ68_DERSI|nr:hypothetical protein HPB49_001388 [Dermacentor silvarum]
MTDRRDQRDIAATESKNHPRHHEGSDSRRDDMERLRQKRATVRAAVTKIINDMTTLMRTEPTPSSELTDHLNLLKIKETMLRDLENQVEEHVTDDNLEDELQSVGQYQESITAQVWALGTGSKCFVRMLIDGGSQRSFITEELSRKLKATVLAKEQLTILGFGNVSALRKYYRRVRVTLHSQYDSNSLEVEAVEVPEICNDLLSIDRDKCTCKVEKQELTFG